MASQRPAVTISDIAAAAGVSAPTVSRVLNGRGDVAAATRERIEALLRDHGYRRRGGQQAAIGLLDLVFNDLDSPWAVELIRGVEDAAHAAGSGTVVSAIHRRASSTRQWLDNVRSRASDGAILVTTDLDPALHAELRELHVPAVVVDPAGVPSLDVPTIGATNWAGGLSATEHLIRLGHRRIGFVSGRAELWCSRARLDGYRAGLETAGLSVDPALIVPGEFDYESGFRAGERLCALPEPPTAVFAASDQMALGVYEALRRRGLRVPEDVSVVGFDDLPEARWSSPPLTTVRQPMAEMGKLAVRTVQRLLRGEEIDSPRVELATELVVRDSTAPAGR
ncbi:MULTISPECIES: LacI family DNA-binding transcriptional regulator [Actinokineospora]|uniref:LacI family transcriptional regulator n=1 Tax=Actinokineospora fastidiosa TaxID=1816 RepID=A0A918GBR0_9PSEU|nr:MULTISPECIES: LacI family DNA-binding transcriptional regulator [Actinokineospora]UVS79305.1 HTH-type transcriptional repressor CytR [Actinokineospora sp. UTMC 2448]GGS27514.1 LacI family transcriptional regulator [Actinokineospora fastidiosa]